MIKGSLSSAFEKKIELEIVAENQE